MQTAKRPRFRLHKEYGLVLFCVLVFTLLAVTVEYFATPGNILLVLRRQAALAVLSTGMTLVILTGGIDLSVGSIAALSAMAMGHAWARTQSPLAAGLAALGTGALCGACNGALVSLGRVPPLIVTLATLSVFRGLAYAFWDRDARWRFGEQLLAISRNDMIGLPVPFWIAAGLLMGTGVYLAATPGGRAIYAIGANAAAAQLSGIPVRAIKFRLYTLNGLLAGLVALMYGARDNSVKPDLGTGDELAAITVVVLGGISVIGGEGSMAGTALAFLILVFIKNGLDLGRGKFNLPREIDETIIAILLVAALLVDAALRHRASRQIQPPTVAMNTRADVAS
jgi:rhamnose transport system permease protein